MPEQYEGLLDEAKRLVEGPRQRDYDSPAVNFDRIIKMWSVILGREVSLEQFVMCMIALKLSRSVHTPRRDDFVDIVGYIHALDLATNDV